MSGEPHCPGRRRLRDVIEVDLDAARATAGAARRALEVRGDQGVVEIAVAEEEGAATADGRGLAFELFEGREDSDSAQLSERALKALAADQDRDVGELAACQLEDLSMGARRVGEDSAFDGFEEGAVAERDPFPDRVLRGVDREGIGEEILETCREPGEAVDVGDEGHGDRP